MSSYLVTTENQPSQTTENLSFRGGVPNTPARFELPHCKLCGSEMTFFFQVSFPEKHIWQGRIMAFFQCTSCFDLDKFGPRTIYGSGPSHTEGPYADYKPIVDMPDNFLVECQTNYRTLLFEVGEETILRTEAKKLLHFELFRFEKANPANAYVGRTKVGGKPGFNDTSIYKVETYKNAIYMDGGFVFLMQIEPNWVFHKLAGSGNPAPYVGHNLDMPYKIFNGSRVFFFGTKTEQLQVQQVAVFAT